MRKEPQGSLLRICLDTSALGKIIYSMQFPSHDMCSFMMLLKFFVYISKYHNLHAVIKRDQIIRQVVAYKRLKTQWKIINPSAPNTGGCCLQDF